MLFAVIFIIAHWYLALFCQSFFLHRYTAHKMFDLSPFWEKFFLVLTIITQGPSFLRPKNYEQLHKRHHLHSDEEGDPHSPVKSKNIMNMMFKTYEEYMNINQREDRHQKIVNFGDSWVTRVAFVTLYIALYLAFTDSYWFLLMVPLHCLLGPIHGMIVNWCGHKYGYRNHSLPDNSKNTLLIDFLMMGELYQNNHHAKASDPNFKSKWIEVDFTFEIMRLLQRMRIIRLKP